jgi:acyl carrier protein
VSGHTEPRPQNAEAGAEVLAAVQEIARTQLDWTEPLAPEMRLIEDLQLDSIRLLTLTVEIENRFRVRLDEHDDATIETVGDLVAAVVSKRG